MSETKQTEDKQFLHQSQMGESSRSADARHTEMPYVLHAPHVNTGRLFKPLRVSFWSCDRDTYVGSTFILDNLPNPLEVFATKSVFLHDVAGLKTCTRAVHEMT